MAESEQNTSDLPFTIGDKDLNARVKWNLEKEFYLGDGSFGKVFKCFLDGRPCAVKQIFLLGPSRTNHRKSTYEEINKAVMVWKDVDHPNILKFYEMYHHETGKQKYVCLFMEYAKNKSLRDQLESHSGQGVETFLLLKWMKQIASGLDYLHSKAIIHRDIKSDNILIDRENDVKICDFDFLRVVRSMKSVVSSGGALAYTAPELFCNDDSNVYITLVDIYAFGFLLWEMITCCSPVALQDYDQGRFILALGRNWIPPRPVNCPDCLWEIIIRCWNKHPDERPSARFLKIHFEKLQHSMNDIEYLFFEVPDNEIVEDSDEDIIGNNFKINAVDKFREELALYYIHAYKWIFPLAWFPEYKLSIQESFTEPSFVQMDKKSKRSSVESLHTVIENLKSSSVRSSILKGPYGIGKSTICAWIAYSWSTETSLHDVLRDYDFLFHVNANELRCEEPILEEMLFDLIPISKKEEREEILNAVRENQERVLIVVDGLDEIGADCAKEFEHLLKGKILPKAQIIATGRPELRHFRGFGDIAYDINGFKKQEIDCFITERFEFTADEEFSVEEKIKYVQEIITNISYDSTVAANPLILTFICILCDEKGYFEYCSVSHLYKDVLEFIVSRAAKKISLELNDDEIEAILNSLRFLAFKCLRFSTDGTQELRNVLNDKDIKQVENYQRIIDLRLLQQEQRRMFVKQTKVYRFPHQSILEYLCAECIVQDSENNPVVFQLLRNLEVTIFENTLLMFALNLLSHPQYLTILNDIIMQIMINNQVMLPQCWQYFVEGCILPIHDPSVRSHVIQNTAKHMPDKVTISGVASEKVFEVTNDYCSLDKTPTVTLKCSISGSANTYIPNLTKYKALQDCKLVLDLYIQSEPIGLESDSLITYHSLPWPSHFLSSVESYVDKLTLNFDQIVQTPRIIKNWDVLFESLSKSKGLQTLEIYKPLTPTSSKYYGDLLTQIHFEKCLQTFLQQNVYLRNFSYWAEMLSLDTYQDMFCEMKKHYNIEYSSATVFTNDISLSYPVVAGRDIKSVLLADIKCNDLDWIRVKTKDFDLFNKKSTSVNEILNEDEFNLCNSVCNLRNVTCRAVKDQAKCASLIEEIELLSKKRSVPSNITIFKIEMDMKFRSTL